MASEYVDIFCEDYITWCYTWVNGASIRLSWVYVVKIAGVVILCPPRGCELNWSEHFDVGHMVEYAAEVEYSTIVLCDIVILCNFAIVLRLSVLLLCYLLCYCAIVLSYCVLLPSRVSVLGSNAL